MSVVDRVRRPVRVEPTPEPCDEPLHVERRQRSVVLVCTPIVCLLFAMMFGLTVALKTVLPTVGVLTLPMHVFQPLHTLMSLCCVFSGICALFVFAGEDLGVRGIRVAKRMIEWLLPGFVALAVLSIIGGWGSGKEYLTWAPVLTPILLIAFGVMGVVFFANVRAFAGVSPEAAWLIGLGLVCMMLGLVEGNLYNVLSLSFGRELSFDWHALDILVAGWNAALYGFGIVIAGGLAKPLRGKWLYVLAAFTFVSTFGHHHYMSPQPQVIKMIAVTASMLAGVSFVRHIRATRKMKKTKPTGSAGPFLRAVEWWTLAAIGTGVLFAIPHVNLVVHGTYAIVGHAMGAMIGINVMLVLGGLVFYLDPVRARRLGRLVVLASIAIALIWIDLTAAGIVKGVLRFDEPHAVYQPIVVRMLYPLPVFGLFLATVLGLICRELLHCVGESHRTTSG